VSTLLIEALLIVRLHDLQVLREARRSSATRVALAGQRQQSIRRCFNVLLNSFATANGFPPETLQLSSQHPREVWTTLWMSCDIQNVFSLDSTKPNRLSQNCAQRGVFRYALPFYEAEGESFLSQIVIGDETWIHHFEPQTRKQSVEWHNESSPRKK
jgi:hypothetical protein